VDVDGRKEGCVGEPNEPWFLFLFIAALGGNSLLQLKSGGFFLPKAVSRNRQPIMCYARRDRLFLIVRTNQSQCLLPNSPSIYNLPSI
jgi:hypothetical protein